MNAAIKADWLAALRGVSYTQGNTRLSPDENVHCALGVLLDVMDTGEWAFHEGAWRYKKTHHITGDSYFVKRLPSNDRTAAGLSTTEELNVLNMNDFGFSFDYIADWIDANL